MISVYHETKANNDGEFYLAMANNHTIRRANLLRIMADTRSCSSGFSSFGVVTVKTVSPTDWPLIETIDFCCDSCAMSFY